MSKESVIFYVKQTFYFILEYIQTKLEELNIMESLYKNALLGVMLKLVAQKIISNEF